MYRVSTAETKLSIVDPRLMPVYLERTTLAATHVVVGVRWGADVIVSFECPTASVEEARRMSAELSADVKAIVKAAKGEPSTHLGGSDGRALSRMTVTVRGDVHLSAGDALPATPAEAVEFLKRVPTSA